MAYDIDADVQQSMDGMRAADEQDKQDEILNSPEYKALRTQQDNPIAAWMLNLPKNVTVGLMDAASNTVNAVRSPRQERCR
jgi:hypothetical protein